MDMEPPAELPRTSIYPSYIRPFGHPTQSFEAYPKPPQPIFTGPKPHHHQMVEKKSSVAASASALPPAPGPSGVYPPPQLFRPLGSNNGERFALPPTPPGSSESHSVSPINGANSKDANYAKDGIAATLMEADLWQSFLNEGNEMIVTKPGRRLFPTLLVSLRGLEPKTNYQIALKITPVDRYRYKFMNMRWVAVGESEILQDESRQVYMHPNSPKPGYFWMKKPISFKPCKITHNPRSKHGNILVHTMHKYVHEIVVTPVREQPADPIIIRINATEFIAVSAYQNTRLTQLKIDHNPFAKGFRDRDIVPAAYPAFPPPPYSRPTAWDQSVPLPGLPGVQDMTPVPSHPSSPSPLPIVSGHPSLPPLPEFAKDNSKLLPPLPSIVEFGRTPNYVNYPLPPPPLVGLPIPGTPI